MTAMNRIISVEEESVRRRAEMTPDYKPLRNRQNRYLQDRQSMKKESYTGIGFNFQIQDLYATEGQGTIQDRTKEHLTPMDIAIVVARKLLAKAIRDLQQGKEPPNVIRDPKMNRFPIIAFKGVLPHEKDWKERVKELEEEICPKS
jgi:phthalate 4,5-dioxygenase oxygenase subunit